MVLYFFMFLRFILFLWIILFRLLDLWCRFSFHVYEFFSWIGPLLIFCFILLSSYLIFYCRNYFFKVFESLFKFLMMTPTLNCCPSPNKLWHFLKYFKISSLINLYFFFCREDRVSLLKSIKIAYLRFY